MGHQCVPYLILSYLTTLVDVLTWYDTYLWSGQDCGRWQVHGVLIYVFSKGGTRCLVPATTLRVLKEDTEQDEDENNLPSIQ